VIARGKLNCLLVLLNRPFDIDLDGLVALVGQVDSFDVRAATPAERQAERQHGNFA